MKCVMCDNKKDLGKEVKTIRYKECGLDNVVLIGIVEYHCKQCGETYRSYGDLDKLNQVIAHAIILKKDILTGSEVRFLRTYLGYSTAVFASLTGYNQSTLSRIENGKQIVAPSFNILVRSLAANKLPDRDYDLHDKWINHEGYMAKTIEIVSGRKGWAIKKAA